MPFGSLYNARTAHVIIMNSTEVEFGLASYPEMTVSLTLI